jgi:hypothetical protein
MARADFTPGLYFCPNPLTNPDTNDEYADQQGRSRGGDQQLHDQVFRTPDREDPFQRSAGIRDGAMSVLIGIAARKSIETGHPVRIAGLTDLEPRKRRI